MITSQQVLEAVSTPAVLSLAQFGFGKFVDNYSNQQALYDSIIMFGSLFTSKVLNNAFVSKIVGRFDNYYAVNFSSYLTEPVLNYFIYNWGYDRYFKKSFKSYSQKSKLESVMIPVLMAVISKAIDQIVIAILTGGKKTSYYDEF
ncbi:hypothetical protein ABPG74_005753 [Tetrahymena malaccensis]